jgi:hypothetical protein
MRCTRTLVYGTVPTISLLTDITRGVPIKFGEWYQKTNKTEDTNKFTLLAIQNNYHPSQHTVGIVHKATGNCQQRPL